MKRYAHLKSKARELRVKRTSLDDISLMLSIPKSTIFYWVKDMPERAPFDSEKNSSARAKAVRAVVSKFKNLRDQAYSAAFASASLDLKDQELRDFICLYMGEGDKGRNSVGFINSDPELVKIAHKFILRLSNRKLDYVLHFYPDHDENEEKAFWANYLGIDQTKIKSRPKPGANKLKKRNTRLKHGIFKVATADTYLKSKIDAYTDFIKDQWK